MRAMLAASIMLFGLAGTLAAEEAGGLETGTGITAAEPVQGPPETTEQAETTVKVKVPADAKVGRWRLMVLTKSVPPQLLEQPVSVVIE